MTTGLDADVINVKIADGDVVAGSLAIESVADIVVEIGVVVGADVLRYRRCRAQRSGKL